jgi:hypothetical protein
MTMIRKKKEKPFAEALDESRRKSKDEEEWLQIVWFMRQEAEIEKNKLRFADWWKTYKKRSWTR